MNKLKSLIFVFVIFAYFSGLSAEENKLSKQFVDHIDDTSLVDKLTVLMNLLDKTMAHNATDVRSQALSTQLAVELDFLGAILQRRIESCISNIEHLRNQIYNSSNINEIKSCMSLIEELENSIISSRSCLEYINQLRQKYCIWLKIYH